MEVCVGPNCFFLKEYFSQLLPWLTNGTKLLHDIKYSNEDSGIISLQNNI